MVVSMLSIGIDSVTDGFGHWYDVSQVPFMETNYPIVLIIT